MTKPAHPTASEVLEHYLVPGEPFTPASLVDDPDCEITRTTMRRRLNDLAQEGKVQKKEMPAATVYWVSL